MEQEKIILTTDQALSMLPDTDKVHTFYSTGLGLVGADRSRDGLVRLIKKSQCEVGGESCQSMNHGLVVWEDEETPLFVECKQGTGYDSYAPVDEG